MPTPHALAELKDRLKGRRIIASISGGKDSAAMSLYLTELGLEHDRVFLDTGWEHEKTYAYLRGELAQKIGPIVELRNEKHPGGMADVVLAKGMFPSRTRRFCTQELKVYPMQRYIRGLVDGGEDVVNAVGIRAAESASRSRMGEWEWSDGFDCETWRPLIAWSEQDVIDLHKRHGLRPSPLYLEGARRVGCWPCIMSAKEEIRRVAEADPARIDLIESLEERVAAKAAARYAAKGESFVTLGYNRPTFFQAMGALRSEGKDGRMVPIREVVAWSRTAHGGKQYEMFAAGEGDAGCMRWGLCDTGTSDK